jgi:lysyl-tRNA synthetase class 2
MSSWKELKDNPRLKHIYETRLEIVRRIREFFWSKNFVEGDTPIAVRLPSMEPYLSPVEINIHDPSGKAFPFFLHTSPEFALKKLLAAGFPKVFEISKCFRDFEEFGNTHNTEFTMLEWYRAPGEMSDFMDDTEEMFRFVASRVMNDELRIKNNGLPSMYHVSCIMYQGKEVDLGGKWNRKTMKEIWLEYVGVNLDEYLTIETLKPLVEKKGYSTEGLEAYEDLFFKIFLNEVEPFLGREKPIFVYNYPANLCSLSRACEDDPRYAERAELYIGGLEIANGFGELGDPVLQKKLLAEDRNTKIRLGKPVWDVDPDFIAALESGFPKASGIALGVDRMVMLFTGAHSIDEVIFQSMKDQV